MDYQRLYEYRFKDVDQTQRAIVWTEVATFVHRVLESPQVVLDPAAGLFEFINAIPAPEKWAVEMVEHNETQAEPDVRLVVADIMAAELPESHFDAIWVSNFLEHLTTQEAIAAFLAKMHTHLKPGGDIAIMGPNFKYCADEYFDCADHTVPLSHIAVAEHLYASGFDVQRVIPRFLPYSFRGRLPVSRSLVRAYLKRPIAWRVLGKQFLLIGRK